METTIERLLQSHANDMIIAQPGEPIINISALAARRKVNGYVGGEITLMMRGIEPALVYSEGRLVWRVPIELATPMQGSIGLIGVLDVDARTSNLIIPINFVEEIEANAGALLKDSLHRAEG
jgi:hypothetical protein